MSALRAPHPFSFPAAALLGLVLPFASIALGARAWRRRKVRRFVSGYAIVAGVAALVIVAGMTLLALLALLLV